MAKKATAGLRGANWNTNRLPSSYRTSVASLYTDDGAITTGYLHACGGEDSVVCMMHPRELLTTHYLFPDVLNAGVAVWVQGSRWVGNDLRLEHEFVLFDVAASMRHLRQLGFKRIFLMGVSGGGALYAFYNQQSLLDPANRLASSPSGRPVNLAGAVMPPADGFVLVSPHPGQGKLLQSCIDPSIEDEDRPLSIIRELDPFSEVNGFVPPPESSTYSKDFVSRYRTAQLERVRRIDDYARNLIKQKAAARSKVKQGDKAARALAAHSPIFTVWRTDADLRSWCTALDPSDRSVGSLWGSDPLTSNVGSVGFGRVCTPESWLSTWSGISSNASFEKCGASIEQPTLFIQYTADNAVFPSDAQTIFEGLSSPNKQRVMIKGNHHGLQVVDGDPNGQEVAGAAVSEWLKNKM